MMHRPDPLRFQWHPRARALTPDGIFTAQDGPPCAQIPAQCSATALSHLSRTLGRDTGFCVSDQPVPGLAALGGAAFATLTGGTSGAPKVIARTQASWIASFHANASHFAYAPTDSIAVPGALGHSLALYGLLEALHLGHEAHVLGGLTPAAQAAWMRTQRCTILYATPLQLRLLPRGTVLPDLRLILCGGGRLDAQTRAHITAICPGAALHVFYGAAETSFITLGCAQTPQGSVGRAYPGVQIDIREADATGIGTIWVRSPYLFARYLGADSPHTRWCGDWLTLGERGHLDAQGFLTLHGRAGRVVTIADRTVYLDTLEERLSALAPCHLIARADPLRGHHLIAVVQGRDTPALRRQFARHCAALSLQKPRHFVFTPRFPLLASGKPDLVQIEALAGALP